MGPNSCTFKVLAIIGVGTLLVCGFSSKAAAQTTVTADFASRTYTGRPIPAEMFGINPAGLTDAAARSDLAQVGFSHLRAFVSLEKVYATRTPNWNNFDWNLHQA